MLRDVLYCIRIGKSAQKYKVVNRPVLFTCRSRCIKDPPSVRQSRKSLEMEDQDSAHSESREQSGECSGVWLLVFGKFAAVRKYFISLRSNSAHSKLLSEDKFFGIKKNPVETVRFPFCTLKFTQRGIELFLRYANPTRSKLTPIGLAMDSPWMAANYNDKPRNVKKSPRALIIAIVCPVPPSARMRFLNPSRTNKIESNTRTRTCS